VVGGLGGPGACLGAAPHRFVSLLGREAVDELGLEPGMLVVAAVKATNVSVEIPQTR
jgi:molybdopterin-binding protein